MKKKYSIAVIVALLFFSCFFVNINTFLKARETKTEEQEVIPDYLRKDPMTIPEDFMVDESFESNLPLIVIDLEGQEIPNSYIYDLKSESFIEISGKNPFINGHIYVFDKENGDNTLADIPVATSAMQIKYRGNSSLVYAKKQYKLELLDDTGQKNDVNLLGMGAESDWILNISMADKSLMRNYLAYTIAGEIDPFTPDVRFCELLVKNGDVFEYKGLYLLMESIKVGENRVDLGSYESAENLTSFLLRRDRLDYEKTMIDTLATQKGENEYISINYPKGEKLTDEKKTYITSKVNQFEELLYSENRNDIDDYAHYIDEQSFIDYFLINEYFGNYDAGMYSTYMYADLNGMLHMGPVWDFDIAENNSVSNLNDESKIVFPNQPWYKQLCKSYKFDQRLLKRYRELEKTSLNYSHIEDVLEEAGEYINDARIRDAFRWADEYAAYKVDVLWDDYGVEVDRNGLSYEQEVQNIKDFIFAHSPYIEKELIKLVDSNKEYAIKRTYNMGVILFVLAFLCAIVVARRK